jgi:hypothetical protein
MEPEKTVGQGEKPQDRGITRKEALRKTGHVALSAATMMLLLGKADKALASSPEVPPPW